MCRIATILVSSLFLFAYNDVFAAGVDLFTNTNRTTITVSRNGKDIKNCWVNASQPCLTLGFALSKPDLNSTTVVLSSEKHYLYRYISIEGVQDLVLTSELSASRPNIICSKNGGSLSFRKGGNLRLASLSFTNCGSNHTSSNRRNGTAFTLFASLFVEECANVILESVTISGSRGMGAVFYDVGGNVSLTTVTFVDNQQVFFYPEKGLSSGGGIYIEFTLRSGYSSTVYNTDATYTFKDCMFQNIVAENDLSIPSPDDDPQNYISFGRGAGVSLMSRGSAAKNRFMFKNCTFRNSTALWGAGIFAEFHGRSGSNKILIEDSYFIKNRVSYGGGAIRTGLASNNSLGFNLITITDCHFRQNHGGVGGAFSQYRLLKSSMEKEVVRFENCTFIENTAFLGSAIHMSVSQFEFHNVTLSNNLVDNYLQQTSGKGALYLFSSKGIFKKENRIENNRWTGIVIEFSSLELFGSVFFVNNTGINGGAIASYAESWIVLREKSRINFIGNVAKRQGGALYVKTPGPPMSPMNTTEFMVYKCVFRFGDSDEYPDDFNSKVRFTNNTAPPAAGSSVFTSTLNWCRKYGEQKYNNSGLRWGNFMYESHDNQPFIITNPVMMELDETDWHHPPSIPFQPRIVLRDELWNNVYGTVKVKLSSETNSVQLGGSDVFAVKEWLPKISIFGRVGSVFTVTVETVVGVTISTVVQNAKLTKCPLGYFQEIGATSCNCLSTMGMVKGVSHCQESTIYILRGRWGNPYDNTENFAKHHCPRNYCRKCAANGTDGIECLFQKKKQCGENRKWDSVLCGSCKKGYSVKLGNEMCERCDDSSLAWLLLWVSLLTVFVAVILIVNVRNYFTYLNAYLYSYQVIPLLLVGNHYLDVFISFVMGLTNFSGTGGNFGVCLWDGLTDMQKMLLNYITPFYIVFCITFFVFLSSHWRRFPFSTQSTLRALAFLSIFAYADFTRITFELLHYVNVNGKNVLYVEGDVEVFKGKHIPYGIMAILVLLFVVVLFPLSLIFFPIVTKFFVKLKGVIDAFQEPFKEGYERFAVFYLICRFVLFAFFVFIETGLVRDTLLAIACEIILIVFLFFKPYADEKMNYFDMVMLSNIAIIGTINVSLDAITETETRRGLQYTAVVMTYLPFLCIFLQFCYWAYVEVRAYLDKRKNRYSNRNDNARRQHRVPQRVIDDYQEEGSPSSIGYDARNLRDTASYPDREFDNRLYESSDTC